MSTSSERHRYSKGQVLVLAALMLTVLIGFVGLAADAGYFFDYRRRMTAAADNAAVSAAMEVRRDSSSTQVTTVARAASAASGFTNGTDGITVTVNHPPVSGYNVGDNKYVEVLIDRSTPTFFMRALNVATATVGARAVSGPGGSGGGCVYVLNAVADGAFTLTGSALVDVPTCNVIVNSISATAMRTSGSACVHALSINITGHLSSSSSCASTPTPVTNIPSEVDPFAGLQAPTVGSCTAHPAKVSVSGGTPTLSPGTYCGGISVSNATVTFSPGLYILAKNTNNSAGVGLTSSGGNTHLLGTGVTFYVDSGAVNVSGGQTVDFSAPTSGTWEGMLFFQSRTNIANATLTGGSTMNLEGVVYFPKALLSYTGGTATNAAYTVIVSDRLTFTGPSGLHSDYASLANGSPVKETMLGE